MLFVMITYLLIAVESKKKKRRNILYYTKHSGVLKGWLSIVSAASAGE